MELLIVQRFTGLNVWDQLAVEIEVNGNLPEIPPNAAIVLPDISDNYQFLQENQIQSASSGQITVNDQNISYTVNQLVSGWIDYIFTCVLFLHPLLLLFFRMISNYFIMLNN